MLGKIMEKIILEVIEKHLENNAVIGHSQPKFMGGKVLYNDLISCYVRVTHLVKVI